MRSTLNLYTLFGSLMVVSNSLFSQNHTVYFRPEVGYGFAIGSENLPKSWGDGFVIPGGSPSSGSNPFPEAVSGSYGAGLIAGLTAGVTINSWLSAELSFNYLFGQTYSGQRIYGQPAIGSFNIINYSTSGNMLRIIPSVVLRRPFRNFEPFVKVGLVIGVAGTLHFERESTIYQNSQVLPGFASSYTFWDGVAWGADFEIGCKYDISKTIGVFLSLDVIAQSFSPKRGVLNRYEVGGVDLLDQWSTNSKEFIFTDLETSSDNENWDSPAVMPSISYPFSSLGFRTGMTFSFDITKKTK